MFNKEKSLATIESYKTHYNYDTSFMEEMINVSEKSYEVFENFLPMASFGNNTPTDVLNIVRITAIKNEDCGTCAQLYVDLAVDAGLDKDIIKEIIYNQGKNLTDELKILYDFTLAVSNNETISTDLYDKINKLYSREVLTEISLAIAATKVFPTIKRTLNYLKSCYMIQIKV
jgi:hypothetical protein